MTSDVNPAEAKHHSRDVSVVTVDDHPPFREAAREVIEATAGFTSVGEACSGAEALSLVDECKPELVLLDVRMPGMDGTEVARRIKASHPGVVVVLISIEEPANAPASASVSGAEALVRKQDFCPSMLRGLWGVHGARSDR
jgi:two-component system, NarL family, invasion response regulator UvrY